MRKPMGFELSRRKAEKLAGDFKKTSELINQALVKTEKHQGKINQVRYELEMLIKMVKAWTIGEYRQVPVKTIVTGLAALIYFINPLDVIPDFLAGLGFIDDMTVIAFVFSSIKRDIDQFAEWHHIEMGQYNK